MKSCILDASNSNPKSIKDDLLEYGTKKRKKKKEYQREIEKTDLMGQPH